MRPVFIESTLFLFVLKVKFLLKKLFSGNLNETISLAIAIAEGP